MLFFLPGENLRMAIFTGNARDLFRIQLANFLLTVATLGVYSFWGRTRVRQYLYSHLELDGDRFQYHGTGGELLLGFVKMVAAVVLAFAGATGLRLLIGGALGEVAYTLSIYFAFALLVPVAMLGSRRYRYSRTSLRGVRFGLYATLREFFPFYLKHLFLLVITLGFYTPVFQVELERFLIQRTRYGDEPFHFDGTGSDLFSGFILNAILFWPTLTLSRFWWEARKRNYIWTHTTFQGVRFRPSLDGPSLLVLTFLNVVLTVFTLGLLTPWIKVRAMHYYAENILLAGDLDLNLIAQGSNTANATGDALSSLLDLGGDLGL
ncbi:MAG: DUF898 domain-containing protein [Bryobacteraceae bacterium]|nr:DUF898 domain-containing protein [Bryobacteraceae bacterium]